MVQKSEMVWYTAVSEGKASDQTIISKKATGNMTGIGSIDHRVAVLRAFWWKLSGAKLDWDV